MTQSHAKKTDSSEPKLNIDPDWPSYPYPPYEFNPWESRVAEIEAEKLRVDLAKSPNPKTSRATEYDQLTGCKGEIAFEGILTYFKVPHIRNSVLYHGDGVEWQVWDFDSPIGTVDVKTVTGIEDYTDLAINKHKWDSLNPKPELIVAIKLTEWEHLAFLCGCIRSEKVADPACFEVKDYHKETEQAGLAYAAPLTKLELSGNEFLEKLIEVNRRDLKPSQWGIRNLFP